MIFDKGTKSMQRRKKSSSINGAGKIGKKHAEEWQETAIGPHIQKLPQNGPKT